MTERTASSPVPRLLLLACLFPAVALTEAVDPLPLRPSVEGLRVGLPSALRAVPVTAVAPGFRPPAVAEIPVSEFGDLVRRGRELFIDTRFQAPRYARNGLNCSSCHLGEGRQPHAMPLWGAYPNHPHHDPARGGLITLRGRMQDCFRTGLSGRAPDLDAPELDALVSYAYWLSRTAPVGVSLPGRGLPVLSSDHPPSPRSGEALYRQRCALCHGDQGQGGQQADGRFLFPPLWGREAYTRGSTLHELDTLARYIKANMPPGAGFSLSDAQALDLASHLRRQRRPGDPRRGVLVRWLDALGLWPGEGN